MRLSSTTSNQWSIGVGLRRSTIFGSNRWMIWINSGYSSLSISWCVNPPRPEPNEAA